MSVLSEKLARRLADRKAQSLYRQRSNLDSPQGALVKISGRMALNFSSNDYLGLANHPAVRESALHSINEYGFGAGASHLVCGHSELHRRLELKLARLTGRDRTLLFPSGFAANLAVQQVLLAKGDAVFQDRLNHASLLDGAQLSGARLFRFAHNDLAHLQKRLSASTAEGKLIAVDAVYSMDGDLAPLDQLAKLAGDENALLMADDAHGFGVLGKHGAGSCEHWQLNQEQLPILMGTLGKAIGSYGAFVAGNEDLIEGLIQFARPYVYSTALPPSVAAASLAALDIIENEPQRRERLTALISYFREQAEAMNLPLMPSTTPIQPILLGDSKLALNVAQTLRHNGIYLAAIRPPTVPKLSARLRVTLTAEHKVEHIDRLLDALGECLPSSHTLLS